MADRPVDAAAVQAALKDFLDPESGRSITTFDQVKDIAIDTDQLSLTLELTSWAAPIWPDVVDDLSQKLRASVSSVRLRFSVSYDCRLLCRFLKSTTYLW
ncbi:MAG: iron-sulfur cluster assembly protein [Planctomycetes bacterium]|nr:iron-sulfur cluster assembly protein [Planctomycetota bacterium]